MKSTYIENAGEFQLGLLMHPREKDATMKIVTSLSFQGQCREAFEFYAKVLGGTIKAAIPYGDEHPACRPPMTSTRAG